MPSSATLSFASGAIVHVVMSFDVAGHRHMPIEIYGTDATLLVPDPNHFGGQVETCSKTSDWRDVPMTIPYWNGNFRSLGLADMAHAIRSDRPHRACSGAVKEMSLIVPISSMSKIEKEEPNMLTAAVNGSVGLGGFHGGMCDAFRDASEYQFMTGSQWVAHQSDIIDYQVDITRPDDPVMEEIESFRY